MRETLRREILARLLLTVGALAPYWPLLTFSVIHVTDDTFMSDIWNGELAGHVWIGEQLRDHGAVPHWTSEICSGLVVSGAQEPLALLSFSKLPPAAALDALLLFWILVAAHGTYSLARRNGAARLGSVLAGIAFAASGYMVCQLKHLSIIGTVVWLPVGLVLLDHALARSHALDPPTPLMAAKRQLCLVAFGFVFAEQVLVSFPQSAYICALVYAAYALYRVLCNDTQGQGLLQRLSPLAGAALAVGLGTAIGAVALLPLAELGSVTDRGAGNSYAWATLSHYWLPNVAMFLFPYLHGDVSDGTYTGQSIFWEDYGYVGFATFLLAIYASLRDWRRGSTRLFLALTVFSYLIVLGPATPIFHAVFVLLPGMKYFRFPTRFLVVVDLGLCLLAAAGLSQLARDLTAGLARVQLARVVPVLLFAIAVGTELDLLVHQTRQNAVVFADAWLEPPYTAKFLQSEPGTPRIYTPHHMEYHFAAFRAAHGWSDLRPYYALRDLIQPNSNFYWGLSTADCYAGISPTWHEDVWGSHTRGSVVVGPTLHPVLHERRMDTDPAFVTLMRTYGVTHVISPLVIPALEPAVPLPGGPGRDARVYRVPNSSRVHVATRVLLAADTRAARKLMTASDFDPDRSVVLMDAPAALATPTNVLESAADSGSGAARIVYDRQEDVLVNADAPRGGFLVLADTFSPGWSAEVDGQLATIYRADVSVRAVALRPGSHKVRFAYHSRAVARGRLIGGIGCALLCSWLLVALVAWWRAFRSGRAQSFSAA